MASLFGTTAAAVAPTPAETSLRVQTSIEGLPRTLLWGQTRLAGNLIWYGDFSAVPATSASAASSGGKGGLFSPSSTPTSSGFNYFASVEIALGEGPFAGVADRIWADKALASLSAVNLAIFLGTNSQLPWSYLTAQHPGQDFAYRYTPYLAGNIALGSSPELPNWTFEATGQVNGFGDIGQPDADATRVISDFLTNATAGVPGWTGAFNGNWANAQSYMLAQGLVISYALTDQSSASSFLAELLTSLNVDPVFSEAVLKLVPRGDQIIAGNGHAYFPPAAPIYDMTDLDYLPNQSSYGSTNDDPVSCKQVPSRSQNNVVKVEYLPRAGDYNPATVIAQDDGSVLLYGERGNNNVKSWHWFQTLPAAFAAAQLALGREQIANYYSITVRPRFILLEPGDVISITDVFLGLSRQWVKITDVQENADRSLNLLLQEYLTGSGAAPLFGAEAGSGSRPNYQEEPGPTNIPFLFEPPDELGHGLVIYAAISGANLLTYGGSDAYVSYDGVDYIKVPGGRQFGSARMGVLTAPLPAVPVNVNGITLDTSNILSVDLSMSGGSLVSVSQADALIGNTASWIDSGANGGVLGFMTATLTAPFKYNLSYLVRGMYGSEAAVVLHPAGAQFVALDSRVLQIPFDQTRIGSTIYLKFLPFNIWGATVDDLSDIPAYTYTITGAALASPLPPVTEVRTVVQDRFEQIWWQEVDDFRTGVQYVIRKGTSFDGGQDLGTLAHPPFIAFGTGTYWIMPVCQPAPGLIVYSDTPVSITISGNMLTANIVQTTDFQALGWLGTFTNTAKEGADPTAFVRLVGSTDILTTPSILTVPDILNAGAIAASGTWAANTGLDVGYLADCYVNISWQSAGIPVGANILADTDVLNNPDVLNAGSGAFIDVWVEIRTAPPFIADIFQPTDVFGTDVPDIFSAGIPWSAWQRYVPGVYRAEFIGYRVVFSTIEPLTIAYLTALQAQVTIPARIDHYMGNTVPTTGLQIIFEPDDATLVRPFNGGPLVGGINNHPLPAVSMDWPGHPEVNFKIDSLDLSQITFHFEDATTAHVLVTGVDTYVEGY
jgi:Putative phage tail protein